jgi:protein-disulfide isomerase
MQKIINRILLFVILVLIALLGYKALKPLSSVSSPTNTTIAQDITNTEVSAAKVEPIIKEYLMNNPEVIIDAIELLQKRKMQEMELKVKGFIQEKKSEIENTNNFPVIGNVQGDVVIVSFFDYNCSYCKRGDNYINQLLSEDHNIKVILRPFPILGESSIYTAKIALAVNALDPSKFKAIHDGLMKMSPISKEAIESLITVQGLDFAKILEEMDKTEIKNILSKNAELANSLRIQGAPAYIINGKLLPGLVEVATFKQIISEIRNDKK